MSLCLGVSWTGTTRQDVAALLDGADFFCREPVADLWAPGIHSLATEHCANDGEEYVGADAIESRGRWKPGASGPMEWAPEALGQRLYAY